MVRRFNTAGPCRPGYHYMIPALSRLPEVPRLVAETEYFTVHAPRQTGKTTTIRALADELTASGKYAALCFSCEVGEPLGDDIGGAQRGVLQRIRTRAESALPPELRPPPWPEVPDASLFAEALTAWARACPGRWCCSSTRSTRCAARAYSACCASCGTGTTSVRRSSPPR